MHQDVDPHHLARELLGRDYDDLEADEQRVLKRVASGTFTGRDADEMAQAHATYGDRLADRVAAIGGSWGFIGVFMAVLGVIPYIGNILCLIPACIIAWLHAQGTSPFGMSPWAYVACVIGIFVGWGTSEILTSWKGYETQVSTSIAVLALGFASATGVFFGFYPAFRASRLEPMDALRYE